MKSTFLFLLLITNSPLFSQDTIYIVVHGTWANEAQWWHPNGDFYETLKGKIDESDHIVSFSWCGENKDSERRIAAKRILELLKSYYDRFKNIIVITHSHGGNLVNLATQDAQDYEISGWSYNENKDPLISILYAMGTPVHKDYYPNMDVIGTFYNLFSYNDYVQPVFGVYGRTYPLQERLSNLSLVFNKKEPGHSELHSVLLAQKLVYIHHTLQRYFSDTLYTHQGRLDLDNHTPLAHSYYVYEPNQLQHADTIELLEEQTTLEWLYSNNEKLLQSMLFEEHENELDINTIHATLQDLYTIRDTNE